MKCQALCEVFTGIEGDLLQDEGTIINKRISFCDKKIGWVGQIELSAREKELLKNQKPKRLAVSMTSGEIGDFQRMDFFRQMSPIPAGFC